MKKMALLLTILCAGQMYGMKQPIKELEIYKSLSQIPELQQEIIKTALAVSKTHKEAIEMIKKLSILHGTSFDNLFGNIKDFTRLVHILAAKSHKGPWDIASKLDIPIAKKYVELGQKFNKSVQNGNINDAKKFIAEGADTNAHTAILYFALLPLQDKGESVAAMIKLLLDNGADPYAIVNSSQQTALEYLNEIYQNVNGYYQAIPKLEYEEVKKLLENAMKK